MILEADVEVGLGEFRLAAAMQAGPDEVVALLGPNGSGKTTMLRAIAGLLRIDAGRIVVDGIVLDEPSSGTFVPPEARTVSLVFQEYLLFRHLRVADNVAFGLRARGKSRSEARAAAMTWLDRFGLADKASDRPGQLSGGQAQRVALARALATEPRLLLLDEPLAALDAGTRAAVRRDMRRYLEGFDGATVLVTHDTQDALALATRVVILESGRVVQSGTLAEVTEHPRSRYVADLVGLNLLRGTAAGTTITIDGTSAALTVAEAASGRVYAVIHPHAVAVHTEEPTGSPRNRWPGRVEGFDLLGDRVRVRVGGVVPLVAEITPSAVSTLNLYEGKDVWTAVKATEISVHPV